MKFKDLLNTLRTINYNTVEIRDQDNNTLFTSPATSPALDLYLDYEVLEWFPGNIDKNINFTVSLITDEKHIVRANIKEEEAQE